MVIVLWYPSYRDRSVLLQHALSYTSIGLVPDGGVTRVRLRTPHAAVQRVLARSRRAEHSLHRSLLPRFVVVTAVSEQPRELHNQLTLAAVVVEAGLVGATCSGPV